MEKVKSRSRLPKSPPISSRTRSKRYSEDTSPCTRLESANLGIIRHESLRTRREKRRVTVFPQANRLFTFLPENSEPVAHANSAATLKKKSADSKIKIASNQPHNSKSTVTGPIGNDGSITTRKKRQVVSKDTHNLPSSARSNGETTVHTRLAQKRKRTLTASRNEMNSNPSLSLGHSTQENTGYKNSLRTRNGKLIPSNVRLKPHLSTKAESVAAESTSSNSRQTPKKNIHTVIAKNANITRNSKPNCTLKSIAYKRSLRCRKERQIISSIPVNSRSESKNSESIATSNMAQTRKKMRTTQNTEMTVSHSPHPHFNAQEQHAALKESCNTSVIKENTSSSSHSRDNESSMKCSVCLDTSRCKKMKFLLCGHGFHEKCVNQWLKSSNKCPICRSIVNECEIDNDFVTEETGISADSEHLERFISFAIFLRVAEVLPRDYSRL